MKWFIVAAALAVAVPHAHALTLSEARAKALAAHPALRAAQAQVDAATARRSEAGRLANPVLSAEVENFGESAPRLETTLRVAQSFDLGGDRSSRAQVAEAQGGARNSELAWQRREVIVATDELFLEAWALQERIGALAQAESLAADAVRAADQRHKAGAALASERIRAESQHALRALERAREEAMLASRRTQLAALWGAPELSDRLEIGTTTQVDDPRRASARADLALEEARLRETKAARVPDLDLDFGVRHLRETGTTGFVAGLAMPLPLWSGPSVPAAEAEVAAARARIEQVDRTLEAERRAAGSRADAAREVLRRLDPLVPQAQRAHDEVRSAYKAGRLGYNDLLEAQRAVREAELATLEATIELTRAQVALARLEDR